MHARTQVGTRVEETANQFAEIQKAIRKIIPPHEVEVIVDNIGLPPSSINLTYNNTGVMGAQDGDIQIALKRGTSPRRAMCASCVKSFRASFRSHVFVPAGRYRQPNLEFQFASANRAADPRQQSGREF